MADFDVSDINRVIVSENILSNADEILLDKFSLKKEVQSYSGSKYIKLVNEHHYIFESWKISVKLFDKITLYIWSLCSFLALVLNIQASFSSLFYMITLFVVTMINVFIYISIIKSSRNFIIKQFRSAYGECENIFEAESLWLKSNLGSSKNYRKLSEDIQTHRKLLIENENHIDFKLGKGISTNLSWQSLISLITAVIALISKFIPKIDNVSLNNIYDVLSSGVLFTLAAQSLLLGIIVYVLVYEFIFIIKVILRLINLFTDNLDGFNSKSSLRFKNLVKTLIKHEDFNIEEK